MTDWEIVALCAVNFAVGSVAGSLYTQWSLLKWVRDHMPATLSSGTAKDEGPE